MKVETNNRTAGDIASGVAGLLGIVILAPWAITIVVLLGFVVIAPWIAIIRWMIGY